jgi:hypothetical protein
MHKGILQCRPVKDAVYATRKTSTVDGVRPSKFGHQSLKNAL